MSDINTTGEPRTQTEIGAIPESWEVVQIGEIGRVVTGNTPKTSVPEYYGGPYMFIAPGDISEAQYVTKTNKYVSAEGLKVLRPLPRDAILVVCIGTIGKAAMTSAKQSVTNQQINAIIPNARAFSHYVYYAVTYRSRSLSALAGRTVIPIVKKSSFAKFPIPLPPTPRTTHHCPRFTDNPRSESRTATRVSLRTRTQSGVDGLSLFIRHEGRTPQADRNR